MTDKDRPTRHARIVWQPEPPFAVWRGSARTKLKFRQALEIRFEEFPARSTLQLADLISVHRPSFIRFRPGGDGILSSAFHFELTADERLNRRRLRIRSSERVTQHRDDSYYLEISGFVGGGNRVWKIDPEVINRAGDPTLGRDEKTRYEP